MGYIVIALSLCLIVSVAANFVQYEEKLDLTERLYNAADWVDPIIIESER